MKNAIKIIIIAIIVIIGIITTSFAIQFIDVSEDFWAYKEIDDLSSTGIINGYPDGSFNSQGTITNAEFLKLLLATCFPEEESFKEVVSDEEHWAKNYYHFAKENELVDESFDETTLDIPITRIEMCRLIAKARIKATRTNLDKNVKEPEFSDTKNLSSDDKILLMYNVSNEFILGYEDNTFRPNGNMTRAEAACIIYRIKNAKVTTTSTSTQKTAKKTKLKSYYNNSSSSSSSSSSSTTTPEDNYYLITFVDYDDTVLLSGDYKEGTPSGDIVLPENPTRSGDAMHTYEFKEWTPEIKEVTEPAIYKASYNVTEYVSVLFDSNGSDTDLSEIEGLNNRNVLKGDTITLPMSDKDDIDSPISLHSFKGWTTKSGDAAEGEDTEIVEYMPGDEVEISGDTTFYAVYTSDLIYSVANEPVLGEGMKAVWWEDEEDPEAEDSEQHGSSYPDGSYSYNMIGHSVRDEKSSKWANAITEDDGSYWVWIPRFAYKIHSYSTTDESRLYKDETTDHTENNSGQIEVIFLNGTSDDEYIDENGNTQTLPEDFIVHPAFQKMTVVEEAAGNNPLGKWDEELEGIWVAKYEASQEQKQDDVWTNVIVTTSSVGNKLTTKAGNTGDTQIRVVSKPNAYAWKNIKLTNMYLNLKAMHPDLYSHVIKNSEWSAAAYLAYSAYGRNGNEVSPNQNTNHVTGSGKGVGDSLVFDDEYTEEDKLESQKWYGEYGVLASTTGNIYGIYDMSGGATELMASLVNNANDYGSRVSNATSLCSDTEIKYKQIYASKGTTAEEPDYLLAGENGIYGDAVWETSKSFMGNNAWRKDGSSFPYSSGPFFDRSGFVNLKAQAGIFFFGMASGGYNNYTTSRPVLIVSSN